MQIKLNYQIICEPMGSGKLLFDLEDSFARFSLITQVTENDYKVFE